MAKQVNNGKAFEYALATEYRDGLQALGHSVCLNENEDFKICEKDFLGCSTSAKQGFLVAARQTIPTICKLEPNLQFPSEHDPIGIRLMPDSAGKNGDVRDVILYRGKDTANPSWQIGFSAKNNHEAVKHSRLSPTIDFGKDWMSTPCSEKYFNGIKIRHSDGWQSSNSFLAIFIRQIKRYHHKLGRCRNACGKAMRRIFKTTDNT